MNIQQFVMKLNEYETYLRVEERSNNTIVKYTHDIKRFFDFVGDKPVSKESVLKWKEQLISRYAPTSVNSMLAAVNGFLEWMGVPQFKVKPLKIQRDIFTNPEKELSQVEYVRLVQAAKQQNNKRLEMLLQTICATGIRVSELKSITLEAVQARRATVSCKGKLRTIFIPTELCRQLKRYCQEQKIENGVIFRTQSGNPIDRSNIWKDMKGLCQSAGVEPGKVFPHNLRHLFARLYYQIEKDLLRLADLLGHSSVSTTRIYTMESGQSHEKLLDQMRLVLEDV